MPIATEEQDIPLFEMDVPQIVADDDLPRARRTDNLTSHRAADKSAETRSAVEKAVAFIVANYGPIEGNGINDIYRQLRSRRGWPEVNFDSPRRRAGELHTRGVITVVSETTRGTARQYKAVI
jgi:hypothetical protein